MAGAPNDFTSNEEIDAMTAGDNTINIIGYVDSVLGSKTVGKPVRKVMYRFIMNNAQGRKIRVVLWEETAVKFERLIRTKDVVHLRRAVAIPVDQRYATPGDDVILIELIAQNFTTIDLLGRYEPSDLESVCPRVQLRFVLSTRGIIVVEGFIKVEFCDAMVGNQNYGTGAITDGKYKLRVHIAQFREDDAVRRGTHVQIEGQIEKDKYGSSYLQVQHMGKIVITDDIIMNRGDLQRGFQNPLPNSDEEQ